MYEEFLSRMNQVTSYEQLTLISAFIERPKVLWRASQAYIASYKRWREFQFVFKFRKA